MGFLHFDFLSETLGYHTNLYFVLPGCTQQGKEPRATLYLLHGGSGNGLDWVRNTALEQWAEKYQLAVVLPEVDGSCFYTDMKYGYRYFTYLTTEVPAIAEQLFPVNREAGKRLVAGLSMGGYGAFKWAFLHPEFFAAAANLSGFSMLMDLFQGPDAFANPESLEKNGTVELNWGSLAELNGSDSDPEAWIARAAAAPDQLPRLFAGIGTEDFSYQHGKRFLERCSENGISVHYEELPGQHEWKVWDAMLGRFLAWALPEER